MNWVKTILLDKCATLGSTCTQSFQSKTLFLLCFLNDSLTSLSSLRLCCCFSSQRRFEQFNSADENICSHKICHISFPFTKDRSFQHGAKYPNSHLQYWCRIYTLSVSVSLGGDAAHYHDRWKVAPHVRDVVNTRWRLGGLSGRGEERLGAKPVVLAPYQSWRDLHPGPGAGRTHSWLPKRHSLDVLKFWLMSKTPEEDLVPVFCMQSNFNERLMEMFRREFIFFYLMC